MNFLTNQAKAANLAALAWLGRKFKNHSLPTRVVVTRWKRDDEPKTTMNIISNILVGLDHNLI